MMSSTTVRKTNIDKVVFDLITEEIIVLISKLQDVSKGRTSVDQFNTLLNQTILKINRLVGQDAQKLFVEAFNYENCQKYILNDMSSLKPFVNYLKDNLEEDKKKYESERSAEVEDRPLDDEVESETEDADLSQGAETPDKGKGVMGARPQWNGKEKIQCDICDKMICRAYKAQHSRQNCHRVAEAKKAGMYDYATGKIISQMEVLTSKKQ